MTTCQEIEDALHRLPVEERWNLLQRFSDELWTEWDLRIGSDLKSGRLNGLLSEARTEITSGKTRPLDEVLNHP